MADAHICLSSENVKPDHDAPITADEVQDWGSGAIGRNHCFAWLAEILNGEYDVKTAREDCLSIVRPDPHVLDEDTAA